MQLLPTAPVTRADFRAFAEALREQALTARPVLRSFLEFRVAHVEYKGELVRRDSVPKQEPHKCRGHQFIDVHHPEAPRYEFSAGGYTVRCNGTAEALLALADRIEQGVPYKAPSLPTLPKSTKASFTAATFDCMVKAGGLEDALTLADLNALPVYFARAESGVMALVQAQLTDRPDLVVGRPVAYRADGPLLLNWRVVHIASGKQLPGSVKHSKAAALREYRDLVSAQGREVFEQRLAEASQTNEQPHLREQALHAVNPYPAARAA